MLRRKESDYLYSLRDHGGILRTYILPGRGIFHFSGFEEPESRDTDSNLFLRYLKNLWRNVKTTGPYFLLGLFVNWFVG